jgi:hypothetical protein
MSRRKIKNVLFLSIGILAIGCLLSGCTKGKVPMRMAPVRGIITYRGKPLSHGQIVVMHSSGPLGAGEIAADGSYKIDAPMGDNSVMIQCPVEDGSKDPKSLIPVRYTNYATSGLTLSVKDGDNQKDWKLVD